MPKLNISIRGMHCKSCEILVEKQLKGLCGVRHVKVSQSAGRAEIFYEGERPTNEIIEKAVQTAGYEVGEKEKAPWFSKNFSDYRDLFKAAVILFFLYVLADWTGLLQINVSSGAERAGLAVALLVGLVAGVSTCMALVGGLALGLSARHAELHPEATSAQKFRPHLYFNLGRALGYGFFGGLVGLLGSVVSFTGNILGILTVAVGVVMIFLGLKLVEIFPALRDKTISLPSGIAKFFGLRSEHNKEYSHRRSMILGALTFFLPCGFTQAMQLYAASTGSATQGALIMFLFALGTAPGLLSLGGLSSIFKGRAARVFFMTAGLAVILFGVINIRNGSRLISWGGASAPNGTVNTKEEQIVRMTQEADGYSPNVFTIEKGRPVKWIINSVSQYSCASSIIVPRFRITKFLKQGENIITFTPTELGEIPFSCAMGMYRGKFIVVDKLNKSAPVQQTQKALSGGGCGAATGGGCGGCGAPKNLETVSGDTKIESTPLASKIQVLRTVYTINEDIRPNNFTVKKGVPTRLEITVKENGSGCMSAIMIPELYNQPIYLEKDKKIVMEFTPTETGEYPITCAMGVPRGVIKVASNDIAENNVINYNY